MNNDEFIKYYSWLKNFNKNNNNDNLSQYGSGKTAQSKPDFSSLTKDKFISNTLLYNQIINVIKFPEQIKNDLNIQLQRIYNSGNQTNFNIKIFGLIYLSYFVNQIKNIKDIKDINNIKIEKLFDKTSNIINTNYESLLNNIFKFIIPKFVNLKDESNFNNIFDKLGKIMYNSDIIKQYNLTNDLIKFIRKEKFFTDAVYKLLTDEYTTTPAQPSSTGASSTNIPVVSFDEFFTLFNSDTNYTKNAEYTEFIKKSYTDEEKKYYNPALYFPFFTKLKDIKDKSEITTKFTLDLLKKLLTQISKIEFDKIDTTNIVKNINDAKSITPTDLDSITDDIFLNKQLIIISPISLIPNSSSSSIKSSSFAQSGPEPTKPIIDLGMQNKINDEILNKIKDNDTKTIIQLFKDTDTKTDIIDNKYLSLLVNNEITLTAVIPTDLKSKPSASPRTTNFISQRGGVGSGSGSGSDSYKFDYILNDTLEYTLTITDIFIIDRYWDFYKSIDTTTRNTYDVSNIEHLQDFKNNWINNIREYHQYISINEDIDKLKDNINKFDNEVLAKLRKETIAFGYNKLKEVLKNTYQELFINKNINEYLNKIDGYAGTSEPEIFKKLKNEEYFYEFNDIEDKHKVFNPRTNTILLDNQLVISDNFEKLLFLKNNRDGYLYGTVSLLRNPIVPFSYDFTKLYLFYDNESADLQIEPTDVSITNICLEIDIKKSKFINAYVFGYNRDAAKNEYIETDSNTNPLYGYKIDLINESNSDLKQFENYENTRYLLFNNEIYELDKYLYETYKSMLLIDTFIFNDKYKYNDGSDKETNPTLKSSYIDTVDVIKQDAMKTLTKTDYDTVEIKSYFGYFWKFEDIFNYNERELDYSYFYIVNTTVNTYRGTSGINDYIYKNTINTSIIRLFANAEEEYIDNKIIEKNLLFDIKYRIYNNKFAINKFQIEFKQNVDNKFLYDFPPVSNYQIMNQLECIETASTSYNIRIYSEIFYKNAGDMKEDSDFKSKIQNTYLDISLDVTEKKNTRNFAPESQIVKIEDVDDIFIAGDLCIQIKIFDIVNTGTGVGVVDELGTIYYNRYTNSKEKTILKYITELNIILFKPVSEDTYYIYQKSEFINEEKSFTKRRFYINEYQTEGFLIMKEINYLNQKYYFFIDLNTKSEIMPKYEIFKNINYKYYSLDNNLILIDDTNNQHTQIFYIENNDINKEFAFYFNVYKYEKIKNKQVIINKIEQNEFIKTNIHEEIIRNETDKTAQIKLYRKDNPGDIYATLTIKLNDDDKIEYIIQYEEKIEPIKDEEVGKDMPPEFIKPTPKFGIKKDDGNIEFAKAESKDYKDLNIEIAEIYPDDINIGDGKYSENMTSIMGFLNYARDKFKEVKDELIDLENRKNQELNIEKENHAKELEQKLEEYNKKLEDYNKELADKNVSYEDLSKRVESLLKWLDENKINNLLD
jgi:hypothetical protein